MKKDKTVRGEANYQRRQAGRQGDQNPVSDNQAAPADARTASGASPPPPPPTNGQGEDLAANGVLTSRASTRSKVADEEVPRAASAPAATN